jgi:hypothetical protein
MGEEGQALFTQDENTGEYVAYTPPDPRPFIETLDEGLRENEHLKGFENANDLAKTLVEIKSTQPTIPETADGYQFEPEEGQEINPERLANWKANLHGLGLSQAQFEGIVKAALEEETNAKKSLDESIENNRKEAELSLQTKWGDKYEQNVDSAIKFYNLISENLPENGKDFKQFMEETKFGDNPQVIEFMTQCATLISEDVITRGSPRPTKSEVARSESGDPMLDDYSDMDRQKPSGL